MNVPDCLHRASVTLLLLVLMTACGDSTAPPRVPSLPPAVQRSAGTAAPGSCTFTIGPNEPAHTTFGWVNSGCQPGYKQLVRVRVTGSVTVSRHPDYWKLNRTTDPSPNLVGTWGPQGVPSNISAGSAAAVLWYPAGSDPGQGTAGWGFDSNASDTSATTWSASGASIWIRRNAVPGAGDCALGPSVCSTPPELIPLYKVTGSQTLVVEPTTWNVSLQGPASIWIGDTATYTAQRIGGGELYVTEWLWQPDAGGPPVTPTCIGASSATPLTCRTAPRSSGIMYVRARTGPHSVIEQADRHTDVERPRLTVTAKPTRLIRGKAATFVARITAAPARLGTVSLGSVQWTWKANTGSAVPACTSGDTVCVYNPMTSGRMQAYAVILGEPDSATVSVDVFACDTTGVPELDDLDIRDSLDHWYDERRAMRKEGLVVISADGRGGWEFRRILTPDAHECRTGAPSTAIPTEKLGGLLVHPHFIDLIGAGIPLPLQCRTSLECASTVVNGVLWLEEPCSPPSRDGVRIADPALTDWQRVPGLPDRNLIFRADSAIRYDAVDDWRSMRPGAGALNRSSVENWRSCVANPL